MNRTAAALLLLTPHLLASGAVVAQSAPDPLPRRVDSLFAEYNRTPSPGLAIAVVRDGKVLLSRGYGLASLEHRVPITSATVFDIASVSKQFAGLAIAMLVEQGKLQLSDEIRKYVPELADKGSPITIDHLVHHTSGLRDWPGTLALSGWRYDDVISFEQILTFAYNQKSLNFTPGSEYSYSNTGYNLLAEVVARVTGKAFRAWTDEQLFQPLGMASTQFRDDHTRMIPNRAFGYARNPDGSYRSISNNLTALGSSSLMSTVDDLAKWVMNFDQPAVGGPAALALSRTRGVLNDGSAIPYAFGLGHGEYRGLPTVSHSGGWASFATFLVHFPGQRFGVIALANSGSVNPTRAAYNVANLYLEKELAPLPPAPTPTEAGPGVAVPAELLDRYTGNYRLGPGWYLRIRRDGNALKTQATREPEFSATARSETEFWVAGYNAPMRFERGADQITYLHYRARRFPRLAESGSPSPFPLGELAGDYESGELGTSYRAELRDSGLVLLHRRHGTIRLNQLWQGDFSSNVPFMRSVEFQRDATGSVTGFVVNVDDRSRDIRFTRKR